jgi:ribosomal protein S18 acetylase RimI-like enzyme
MNFNHRLLLSIVIIILDAIVVFHHTGFVTTTNALVVTSPRWRDGRITTPNSDHATRQKNSGADTYTRQKQPELVIKIRSTTQDDIPTVSSILSHALVEEEYPETTSTPFNFKRKMEFLKTRAGVVSLLQSRIDAITIGNRLWQNHLSSGNHNHDIDYAALSQADKLRHIWSNDSFRIKLEKAAKLSDEPHIWKNHNFACAPSNSDWLCHKMLTAENAVTGEIAGFCEVAMLTNPNRSDHSLEGEQQHNTDKEPVPTIVNLVTSTAYRRRGVASSILKSATRFVQQAWSSEELALFVERDNAPAVKMYEALGFEIKHESISSQYYMTATL